MKRIKEILSNPFVIMTNLYLLSVLLIYPKGEFVVNDDWIFVSQIKSFLLNNFKISNLIDPSFIFQGLLGYVWTFTFGYSLNNLRILTVIIALITFLGVYKILKYFNVSKIFLMFILILVIFNPLIFTSSMSFMTEIYFLIFFIWSLYFYLKASDSKSIKHSILGTLFCGLSVLVRQTGIFIFLFYFVSAFFCRGTDLKKKYLKSLFINSLIICFFILIYFIWPRYGSLEAHHASGILSLIKFTGMREKFFFAFYSIFYFIYFIFPLALSIETELIKIKSYKFAIITFFTLALTLFLFKHDIFPIGNILYIEGLYIKSNFKHYTSLFDNMAFKLLVSLLISISTSKFIISLYENRDFLFNSKRKIFLLLLFISNLFVFTITADFYDRYLLTSFICLIFFITECYKDRFKKFSAGLIFSLIFFVCLTLFLQYDFISSTKLKWEYAYALQKTTGYVRQIGVEGNYIKYMNVIKTKDFSGLSDSMPVEDYKCYVQKYVVDTESFEAKIFNKFNDFTQKLVENPKIYQSRKDTKLPRIKNNLNMLVYNNSYFSPMYDFIGKKAYVGAWCLQK